MPLWLLSPASLVRSNWLYELSSSAVRRAHRAAQLLDRSDERCPQLTQPQVRLLSVSAGTSLQGAARNPRANPHEHSASLRGGCGRLVVVPPNGSALVSCSGLLWWPSEKTDPELKHLAGIIGGARSGRSRVGSTKKRADLGSSCHVGHGSATFVVDPNEIKKLRKPGLMSPTEKPAQTRRIFFDIFLVESTRT